MLYGENHKRIDRSIAIRLLLCASISIIALFHSSFAGKQLDSHAKVTPADASVVMKTTLAAYLKNPQLVSLEKRQFPLYMTQPKSNLPKVLIKGGMHGNERGTAAFIQQMIKNIKNGQGALAKLNNRFEIHFLPVSNPDGYKTNNRYNARKVNLNRNFSVLWGITRENPGKKPFSEPETKALKELIETQNYFATIDVHGFINWLVTPSMKASKTLEKKKSTADLKKLMKSLSNNSKNLKGSYKVLTAASLGDGGAFEDWAFWKAGAFAFCLELHEQSHFNTRSFRSEKPLYASKLQETAAYETFVAKVLLDLQRTPRLNPES